MNKISMHIIFEDDSVITFQEMVGNYSFYNFLDHLSAQIGPKWLKSESHLNTHPPSALGD